jgi:glycine/D-amino acid oxidase-like deaminating enzyme
VRIGVLGGGLQGCCCALALAERGVEVILFDQNAQLLSRAAVANEGKVHLGYMYANDPSYSTARIMMNGALAFAPFITRHLEIEAESLNVSQPAAYVVHCDSQRSSEQVYEYLLTVHSMISEAAEGRLKAYFGKDLLQKPRQWSTVERDTEFDPDIALEAFDTPEVAINPVALAKALRERIHSEPRIEVRLAHQVLSVHDINAPVVLAKGPDGAARDAFDYVINALWDGRLAIDDTLGLRPGRPWLHRLKYGVSFYLPKNARSPRSATFVSGPFGEVVTYNDGLIYLTWYPVCLLGLSADIAPPDWRTYPDEPVRSELLKGTLDAMAEFVVSLRGLIPEELVDVTVKGGAIVAWGETDIYDPQSELHKRYEIGVTSNRRFHSVDPGKLTMAPYFAQVCAGRILNGGPL